MKNINYFYFRIFIIILLILYLYTIIIKKYYFVRYNFLDKKLIDEIYLKITSEKKWLYTTNVGNKKIKNNVDIVKRKQNAIETYNKGMFSYSKYEYDDNTYIVNKIKNILNRSCILDKISNIVGENITKVMDIFISKYEYGDFLSIHDDKTLGKYAFMIYLNKNWDSSCGGNLNIIKNDGSIDTIIPEYNKLILFDVYSRERLHYIDINKCNRNRYAITGWFA